MGASYAKGVILIPPAWREMSSVKSPPPHPPWAVGRDSLSEPSSDVVGEGDKEEVGKEEKGEYVVGKR